MIGPVVVVVVGIVGGAFLGGWAGLVVGIVVAVGAIAAVVAAASIWVDQIGRQLEPDEAWNLAPRPPGFGPLCNRVYARLWRSD